MTLWCWWTFNQTVCKKFSVLPSSTLLDFYLVLSVKSWTFLKKASNGSKLARVVAVKSNKWAIFNYVVLLHMMNLLLHFTRKLEILQKILPVQVTLWLMKSPLENTFVKPKSLKILSCTRDQCQCRPKLVNFSV